MTAEAVVVAVDDVQWHVRCPYGCRETHHHGAGSGLRTPHCRVWPLPPDYLVTDLHGLTSSAAA